MMKLLSESHILADSYKPSGFVHYVIAPQSYCWPYAGELTPKHFDHYSFHLK